jgi:inosine-uridine nucleoside N-ribohydrolase
VPTPRLLLDCDPGHDDVVAILVASRRAELLGITTVAGNAPVDATTHNALLTCQLFGLDVPVVAGATRPLVAPPRFAPNIHGASGLAGPVLPPLHRSAQAGRAADFIVETVRANPGMWIVATGPLTNVAMALRLDPGIADLVAGISIMGGGVAWGNTTPAAEFNIWADPEAADIVFRCGARLLMMPIDVTHQVLVAPPHIARLRELGTDRSTFMADVFVHFSHAYREVFFDEDLGPLHDPCAVLAITDPHLFGSAEHHVVIEIAGEHTRGMTLVDTRGVKGMQPPNVTVALTTDGASTLGEMLADVEALCR